MAAWIDAITSPLKAAGEMAQGLVEIRDTVKFGDAVIKLQAQIMSAQQGAMAAQMDQASLLEEIRTLKTKVTELEGWEAEKKRYERKNIGFGAFAYVLKPDERGAEPPHWICTNCYEHKHIATLQLVMVKGTGQVWTCPGCKNTINPGTSTVRWPD